MNNPITNDIRRHSVAEFRLANLLTSNGIAFSREFSLPGSSYRFDFAITEVNGRQTKVLIEHDGAYHMEESFIGDRKGGLNAVQARDAEKDELAAAHGWSIHRIKDEKTYTRYEALANQLSSVLETEVAYADYLPAFQRDMSREVTQTALGFGIKAAGLRYGMGEKAAARRVRNQLGMNLSQARSLVHNDLALAKYMLPAYAVEAIRKGGKYDPINSLVENGMPTPYARRVVEYALEFGATKAAKDFGHSKRRVREVANLLGAELATEIPAFVPAKSLALPTATRKSKAAAKAKPAKEGTYVRNGALTELGLQIAKALETKSRSQVVKEFGIGDGGHLDRIFKMGHDGLKKTEWLAR